jgi:opacity protein-like surface antigen
MKKAALVVLVLFLGTSFAFADEKDTSKPLNNQDNTFYLGFGGGTDLLGANWNSNYAEEGGLAQVFGGYRFDQNWDCQLEVDNCFFEGNAFSQYNLRTLAAVKYAFSIEGWQPYLLAGPGIVYSSLLGVTASNLDVFGGLGVQFNLSTDTHLFVEAKYNFILPATGSFQDFPISTGLWVSLP